MTSVRSLSDALIHLGGLLARADDVQAKALAADVERLARLASPGHPVLVVVGGSTGTGKSTLVNTIVGRRVSAAGVLRPTTRVPVLLHHPEDGAWFERPERIACCGVQVVVDDGLPRGLALLDSPDMDSVDEHNRTVAASLADVADLWLVVTSAARYADAVPWTLLRRTVSRRAATAVVLNRVEPVSAEQVAAHLATIMAAEGLVDSPLFIVPEHPAAGGLLPTDAVATLTELLSALAGDVPMCRDLRRPRLQAAVAGLTERLDEVGLAERHDDLVVTMDEALDAVARGLAAW